MKAGDIMQVDPYLSWVRAFGLKRDGRPDILRGIQVRGGDLVLLVADLEPHDLAWRALWNGTLICISPAYLYPCESPKGVV